MIFFLWIVFSVLVGVYASSKKINGGFILSFIVSLIFTPIIGLIVVALSRPNENKFLKDGMKKCPHCAELIKEEASVCRYCGRDLIVSALPGKKEANTHTEQDTNVKGHRIFDRHVVDLTDKQESKTNKNFWKKDVTLKGFAIVVGIVIILFIILGLGKNNNSDNQSSVVNTSNSAVEQISSQTGSYQSDINGEISIINRYGLDAAVTNTVALDAAKLYAIESSGQYSALMKQAGVGSLDNIADTLAHLMKSWQVSDSDASHADDVVFNALTQSTLTWNDLTGTLVTNGPKMSDYVSLSNAAASLAGLQKNMDSTSAISVFNTVGDALENPSSKLNITLGGTGYIRKVVKQGGDNGIITAIQKISDYIQAHQ